MDTPIVERLERECKKCWEKIGSGKLLVALSGGADSTALLICCHHARIPVEAAHCNFNLRGQESLRDEKFVSELCNSLKIKLHKVNFDTLREKQKGESVEMTCRRLRYEFFNSLKELGGFSRIAVAHNADDNIETFFLNAFRGSGTSGLKAIEEDTGLLLRPLLPFSRLDILQYLKARSQTFITDSSNASSNYRRNFLRNEIIPLLASRWEGLKTALSATIDIQRRENTIIRHFVRKALENVSELLPWEVVKTFPDSETIIYYFLKSHGVNPSICKEIAESSLHPVNGKMWFLEDGCKAVFTKNGIRIEQERNNSQTHYCWTKIEKKDIDMNRIKQSSNSEIFLPADEGNYIWKRPDKSMKIKSLGMATSQSVWKILKDAGLTMRERDEFRVLCCRISQEPVWVPGYKRSRHHLVNPLLPFIYHVKTSEETKS